MVDDQLNVLLAGRVALLVDICAHVQRGHKLIRELAVSLGPRRLVCKRYALVIMQFDLSICEMQVVRLKLIHGSVAEDGCGMADG